MKILEYVRKHKTATISSLAAKFNVHEATVRRDLSEIEKEGFLKRTHGGVVVDQWTHEERPFHERTTQNYEEKMRIGKKAASFVEEGDTVIIDSGTTTQHIAKNLVNHKNITVITNDMNVAAELRYAADVTVILTGGELYTASFMLNGIYTDYVLNSLHVLKAFIGTPAFHPKHGLMHMEERLIPAKQSMIKAAQEIFVVTDHSKIGKVALHTYAPTNQIQNLITGQEVPDLDIEPFREEGINVFTV